MDQQPAHTDEFSNGNEELPVRPHYVTPAMSNAIPTLRHSGMTIGRFFWMHVLGGAFPVVAGLMLFGWRALGVIAAVMGTAALMHPLWRRIGPHGRQMRWSHTLWLALLLSLMLPAHLLSGVVEGESNVALGPMLPAAGIVLVWFTWLLGGVGSSRVHPVILTYLLMVVLFGPLLVPHTVLRFGRVFLGDVNDAARTEQVVAKDPWKQTRPADGRDAMWREPASQRLVFFTSGLHPAWMSLEGMLRDRIPPLEDLIIAGQPAPIGCASNVAVIVGGLFLLYRGLIDFRIPLLICLVAYGALLVLPIPVVISEGGAQWLWLAGRQQGVGWPLALTFVNYEMMAGPALFMAFFLATAPAVRPMSHRGRVVFAILVGILTSAMQLYASVSFGPYLALLLVSLLTPALDRFFRPRALI
jgi:Na+-translocating ferredoxin:NAD+ oxidoreductase RnfD subunit